MGDCSVTFAHTADDAYDIASHGNHRGNDAAGICRLNPDGTITVIRWIGRVDSFGRYNLRGLLGTDGQEKDGPYAAHTRYRTHGSRDAEQILRASHPMPIGGETVYKGGHAITRGAEAVLVLNGTIPDRYLYPMRNFVIEKGRTLETDGDTEIFLHYLDLKGIDSAIREIPGSYSAIFMHGPSKTTHVFRDRHGTRPLTIGKKDGRHVAASESFSIENADGVVVEELDPGSMAIIHNGDYELKRVLYPDVRFCHFEPVYLQKPRSRFARKFVGEQRERAGKILHDQHRANLIKEGFFRHGTVLTYIPTCPYDAAVGFGKASGLDVSAIFYKVRDERAFLQLDRASRESSIRSNLYIDEAYNVGDANVILIDDSLIRGVNSRVAVEMLKKAGANKVALLLTEPMVGGCEREIQLGCERGVAMPPNDEFATVEFGRNPEKIGKGIGVDYLGFMEINGLTRALDIPADKLCMECIGGPRFD